MNMFKSVKANSIEEYFDILPIERHEPVKFLHEFIQKIVPSFKPYFAFNMLGYGSFKYHNYKKEIIDWPIVAIANQKNYISIYVCAVKDGEYIAEKYKHELGKVSVGKSCIRLKKIEDINLESLARILKLAEIFPGLEGIGASSKHNKL